MGGTIFNLDNLSSVFSFKVCAAFSTTNYNKDFKINFVIKKL